MIRLLLGDVRARCADLPAGSVQAVVTSIPYYGLRSYNCPPQVWGGCQTHAHGFTETALRKVSLHPKRDHAGSHDFGDSRGEEQYRAGTVAPTSQGAICDHEHEWSDPVRAPWANEVPGPNAGGKNEHRLTDKTAGQVCVGHHHKHEWQAVDHRSESSVRSSGRRNMQDVGRERHSESMVCVAPCEHAWAEPTKRRAQRTPEKREAELATMKADGYPSAWATGSYMRDRLERQGVGGGSECTNGCGAWLGELGLEPTYEMFIEHVREAFRAIHRVLRDDGTLWLNVGDSYAGSNNGSNDHRQNGKHFRRSGEDPISLNADKYKGQKPGKQQLRAKNLMLMPWRVAMALQEDPECKWILRSNIHWLKTNPMPESTRSRPTNAAEQIFMFAKSDDTVFWLHPTKGGTRKRPKPDFVWLDRAADYAEMTDEPALWRTEKMPDGKTKRWRRVNLWEGFDYFYDDIAGRNAAAAAETAHVWGTTRRRKGDDGAGNVLADAYGKNIPVRLPGLLGENGEPMGRNLLNYWLVSSDPCPDAHFATFPRVVPMRCIEIGTSEKGACPSCGAPWVRIVERAKGASWHDHGADLERGQSQADSDKMLRGENFARHYSVPQVKGWSPTCDCFCGECQGDGRQMLGINPVDGLPIRLAYAKCPTCAGTGWPSPRPCVVMDPFGGSGRTAVAADRLGRDTVVIELKPSYAVLAHKTMTSESPMFTEVQCDPDLATIKELADAESGQSVAAGQKQRQHPRSAVRGFNDRYFGTSGPGDTDADVRPAG